MKGGTPRLSATKTDTTEKNHATRHRDHRGVTQPPVGVARERDTREDARGTTNRPATT
jgi:hypothetical protein